MKILAPVSFLLASSRTTAFTTSSRRHLGVNYSSSLGYKYYIKNTNKFLSFASKKISFSKMSTDSNITEDMGKISSDIAANIQDVKSRIKEVLLQSNFPDDSVCLIAVSKTKPTSHVMAAYNAGQRYFGENYVQELLTKAEEMPDDCKWHFIGPLQSNKASRLVKSLGLQKLACVETVSSMSLANKLSNAVKALKDESCQGEDDNKCSKLGIYIQVNTSGEDTKSGVTNIPETVQLVREISNSDCINHLSVNGLMTIGAPGDFSCFDMLVECRKAVAEELGVDVSSLALSMGMSGDFEEAIKRGATSVRVGSTIFGARDYSISK